MHVRLPSKWRYCKISRLMFIVKKSSRHLEDNKRQWHNWWCRLAWSINLWSWQKRLLVWLTIEYWWNKEENQWPKRNSITSDISNDCRNEMGDVKSNKWLCRNLANGLQIMFTNSIDLYWWLYRTLYWLDTIIRSWKC